MTTTEESIVVGKCAEAIGRLSTAIRYPRVSVQDIQQAIELCKSALQSAKVMDPEE